MDRTRGVSCDPSRFHWWAVTAHGMAESNSRMVATTSTPLRRGIVIGRPRNPSEVSGSTSHVHSGRVNAE